MVNPAQCAMLGYGEPELIGRRFAEFTSLEDVQSNLDLAALVRNGDSDVVSMEKRYVRKDGSLVWVLLTVGRIHDVGGALLGTVGIAQDITERREAEARRLEYAHRQRDTLVREVHHRIKNHLQGLAGLLRRQMAPHPELAPVLDGVVAQIGAIGIVHGLQGKTGTGQASLRGLVEEIAAFLRGIAAIPIVSSQEGRQCFREMSCDRRQDCPWAIAEEESVSLALVINELLTNAVRHGAGDGPVTLEVGCDAEGGRVVIRNPGRLAAEVDFARSKGLGTGLTLVRALLPQRGISIRLAGTGEGVETRIDIAPPVLVRTVENQVASLR